MVVSNVRTWGFSKELIKQNYYTVNSSIVVFGVDSNNEIKSIGFSTKDFTIDKLDAKDTGLSLHILSNYPNIFQITKNNILKYNDLENGIIETISYLSTVDETVNSHIFTEKIEL